MCGEVYANVMPWVDCLSSKQQVRGSRPDGSAVLQNAADTASLVFVLGVCW